MVACNQRLQFGSTDIIIKLCPHIVTPPTASYLISIGPLCQLATKSASPLLDLLLEAGYIVSRREMNHIQISARVRRNVAKYIQKHYSNVRTLKWWCRRSVRLKLHCRLEEKVGVLPIPKSLQDDLVFKDDFRGADDNA